MEALYDLLVNAYTKFLASGLSVDHARYGVFGIWIGPVEDKPLPVSDSQLERARASSAAWPESFGNLPNPYADLVSFYETGASLGRWENHILDVYGPDGEKLWGIPRSTLLAATKSPPVQEFKRARLSDTDYQLFLVAWESWGRTGNHDICCDLCGSNIIFEKTGAAVKHSCSCGRFTGALRGP